MSEKNLVYIEFKKNKVLSYIKYYIGITLVSLFVVWTTIWGVNQDHESSYSAIIKMMTGFITDVYFFVAAIAIIKIVVEEFSQKTIMLLFSYGISRKKIVHSKTILSIAISTVGLVIGFITSLVFLVGIDNRLDVVNGTFIDENLWEWANYLILDLIALIGFVLLQMTIAIIKKTSSSVFVISLLGLLLYQIIISQVNSFYILYICLILITIVYFIFYVLVNNKYIYSIEL